MKNLAMMRTISIIFAALTLMTSCQKFLEEEQVATLSYGYYETEQGCEALINACYSSIRLKAGNEWSYGMFNYGTDEYMKGYEWTQPYAQPEYNDYTPDLDAENKGDSFVADVGDLWAITYNGIDRCNVAIDKIAKVENGIGMLKDQEGKDIRTAEVRFLRAYHYFVLVQQFGAIPLTLEPSSGLEFEWPRIPIKEVYDAILEDLAWAYDHIPEVQSQVGRVDKDVVRHYWAKVLLTRASYVAEPDDNPRDYDRGGNPAADLQKAADLIEEIRDGGRHSLVPDYADLFREGNEVNDEIIFAIQYNAVEGLNYSDASAYKNQLHEFWFNQYDVPDPGMARNIEYGRPFRRLFLTDYAIDIHDRLNDSRLRKSLLEVYYCTQTKVTEIPTWKKEELGFAFDDVAPDSSWAIRYGDTVRVGEMKFAPATAIAESEHVIVGDTGLVFLLNDEHTTLTDRQMIAAGYTIYARYYWATDASGNPTELITFDRDDDLLESTGRFVEGSSTVETATWNRNKSPSLIKYWDRNKPGGYNSHWGTRDVFLARLGETYLMAAEIYGRMGDYNKAAEYINLVRERAAYKDGEEKPNFWHEFDGGLLADATEGTVDNMMIDASYWDDNSHDAAELYPDGVDTKEERFIAFILNERCREMLGEMVRWEDLVRTNSLVERAMAFNDDTRNSGTIRKFHRIRPIPQIHLDAIKVDGRFLTAAEKQEYQNEGYH
jgi:hypothetical protein